MSKLFKKVASLTLATTLMGSIFACNPGNQSDLSQVSSDDSGISSVRKAGQKKWTLLVYLAADNNLYPFGLKDMAEMAYGFSNPTDVNIVVLFDGAKNGDSAIYEVTHSDKKPSAPNNSANPITSKKVATHDVFTGAEIDSGDDKVFAKFMDWGTKTYPADNTGVVIWNHGSGMFKGQPKGLKASSADLNPSTIIQKGFAWDDNGGHMDTKDLDPAFALAMKNTGKKIAVLDFDACLMAHVEIAYHIKDQVNYLVASEKTEAGDGNDYIGIAQDLSKNPGMSGADFAKAMVKGWDKSYNPGGNQYSGRKEEYTLSAVDTALVGSSLAPAINDLGTELAANPSVAKNAQANAATYDGDPEPRDIGDFISLLNKDAKTDALKGKVDKVSKALKSAVIEEAHTDKKATNGGLEASTGLVIYLPGPGDRLRTNYFDKSFNKFADQTGWADFLKKFTASSK